MGILDRFTRKTVRKYVPLKIAQPTETITESAKSKTDTAEKKAIAKVGEEHPAKFELLEDLYKKVPIITGAINKTVDMVVSSDFSVKSKNPEAAKLIQDFMKEHNFDLLLRNITKDLLIYGNAFVEVISAGNVITGLKAVNPKTMYVKRNEQGEILAYNQYIPRKTREPIEFTPDQIVHFKYNVIGDCAYGYSIIEPLIKIIKSKLQMEEAMMTLMKRKANAPIHAKLGTETEPARQEDIDNFANDLYIMNEKTEYVTDHRVEMNVLDVGGRIANFQPFNEHFENQLVYDLEVPIVLLGRGSIPEGLAKVQLDAFERRINSIRLLEINVLEDKIFNPLLEHNGFTKQDEVSFEWAPQTDEDKWKEIERALMIMTSGMISEPTRKALERKILALMGLDDVEPGDQPIQLPQQGQQGQPTPKPTSSETPEEDKKKPNPFLLYPLSHEDYSLSEAYPPLKPDELEMTVEQWTTRKTSPIWNKIESFLSSYNFSDITGLSATQRKRLRGAMLSGMEKNISLSNLTNKIKNIVGNRDRAERIARTESVRATTMGLLEDYKDAGIKRYRWVTIQDPHRCAECASRQGKLYEVNNPRELPPLHPNCRCTITAVI